MRWPTLCLLIIQFLCSIALAQNLDPESTNTPETSNTSNAISVTTDSTTTSGATTTTTSTATAIPAESRAVLTDDIDEMNFGNQRFGASLFFIGGYYDQQFRNSRPSFDIYDSYIALSYFINNDVVVSARPAFGYSTQGVNSYGDEVTDQIRMRDFSFAASIRNILEDYIDPAWSIKFKPRLYLPTSAASKDSGMIARLRLEWEVRRYLSRYSYLKFYVKPSYFFQRNTVALTNTNPKKPNQLQTTAMADSEHGVMLSVDLSRTFSVQGEMLFDEFWSNTSDVNTDRERTQFRQSSFLYGGGLEVRPTKTIMFIVGVRTEKNLILTDRSDETSYSLLFNSVLF